MPNPFDLANILILPFIASLVTIDTTSAPRNASVWLAWTTETIKKLPSKTSSSSKGITQDTRIAV
ncbi:hypothetical protein V8J82_20645 [Gymnodinialimonas sp. 2305UL16-5]|uniref:hypothetical protein n=1 Tax=Gymnodinialimonas mytili TaxID=3126503 RepID=UPI00309A7A31